MLRRTLARSSAPQDPPSSSRPCTGVKIVRGELRPGDTLPSEQSSDGAVRGVQADAARGVPHPGRREDLISVKRGSAAAPGDPAQPVGGRPVRGPAAAGPGHDDRGCLRGADGARACAAAGQAPDQAGPGRPDREEMRGAGEGQPKAPEPALWSSQAARFHELIMQRSGSKTLAVQGGVLQDIVATHLAMALSRDRAGDDELANFRRNARSYDKESSWSTSGTGTGAERHRRAHMEAAGQRLLREDLQSCFRLFTVRDGPALRNWPKWRELRQEVYQNRGKRRPGYLRCVRSGPATVTGGCTTPRVGGLSSTCPARTDHGGKGTRCLGRVRGLATRPAWDDVTAALEGVRPWPTGRPASWSTARASTPPRPRAGTAASRLDAFTPGHQVNLIGREVALRATPWSRRTGILERSGGSGAQTCFSSDVRTTSGAGRGVRVTVGCGEGEGAAASFDEPQAEATSERPQARATSFPTAPFIAAPL